MVFTGIVEAVGVVAKVEGTDLGQRLGIKATAVAGGLEIGNSVAINGACLTAVAIGSDCFSVEAVPETLARTNLGDLGLGSRVNLERAMPASGRFDGHFVQGHIDATGDLAAIEPEGEGRRMTVQVSADLARYLVEKGSVTVDGVSLTIASVRGSVFEVALIPHTLEHTTLGDRVPADRVNVEVDILAKYVERLLRP